MATYYKRSAAGTTNLALNTAWSTVSSAGAAAATPPGSGDIALWDSGSLGNSAYTGAMNVLGIQFNGAATGSVSHSSGTVITLGSSGWSNGLTNNRLWTENGNITVGSTNQTWNLYTTTADGIPLAFGSTGLLQGSATITVQRTAGSAHRIWLSTNQTNNGTAFTGKMILLDSIVWYMHGTNSGSGANVGLGSVCTVQIDGSNVAFANNSGTAYIRPSLILNNNFTLGQASPYNATTIVSGNITFGSGAPYTLTVLSTQANLTNINMSSANHQIEIRDTVSFVGTTTFGNAGISNIISATTAATGIMNFSSAGTLALGSGSHTFTAPSGWSITGSSAITGTNGFTKDGASLMTLVGSSAKAVSGVITINGGDIRAGSTTFAGDMIPSITAIAINGASTDFIAVTSSGFTFNKTLSGTGNALFEGGTAGSGITVAEGLLPAMSNASATYGSGIYVSGTNSYVTISDFPAKLGYVFAASGVTGHLYYAKAAAANFTGTVNLDSTAITSAGSGTATIYNNNGSTSNTLTLSGPISRSTGSVLNTFTVTLQLNGSNAGDNLVSGIISGSSVAPIALSKAGSGKWVVSGANSYTGATSFSAGTIKLTNGAGGATSSLGSSTSSAATTLSGGATVEFSGGISINKAFSPLTVNTTAPTLSVLDGANTLTMASGVLNASLNVTMAAGSSLTLPFMMSGTGGITVTSGGTGGTGTLNLSNSFSQFSGALAFTNGGTVIVAYLANYSALSSIGAPASGNITVSGTETSTLHLVPPTVYFNNFATNRNIVHNGNSKFVLAVSSGLSGAAGTDVFDFTYNGTYSSTGSGARTLELSGDRDNQYNVYFNRFATTIADSTFAGVAPTSLIKSGTSAWDISAATYTATGSVTCNQGVISFGFYNRTFAGGLTINAGTVVSASSGSPITIAANLTMSGGVFCCLLTGANTINITSSATESAPAIIYPADGLGNNANTGNVSVNGCVDLRTTGINAINFSGRGRLLGASNTVTVSSTGIIRTTAISEQQQRGMARYNNLTLQTGSTMKIGFGNKQRNSDLGIYT